MPNEKIMIVEDEWFIANDIQKCVLDLGYNVSSVVSSGKESIQMAKEEGPDLVLMDIVLQGEMDGIEAARQITSNFNIPIIYLTACTDERMLERAKITEPFGYVIKPFEERELYITIEIALYKHRADDERKKLTQELQDALANVKKLSGLLPICSSCKKIRDDKGYWNEIDTFIQENSEADFTHGICPACSNRLYPDL